MDDDTSDDVSVDDVCVDTVEYVSSSSMASVCAVCIEDTSVSLNCCVLSRSGTASGLGAAKERPAENGSDDVCSDGARSGSVSGSEFRCDCSSPALPVPVFVLCSDS